MPDQHAVPPGSPQQQSPAGAFAAAAPAPAADARDGTANGDWRLGAIAALCITLSLAGVLVHALGLVSAPVAVTVVLLPVGVGLRVALIYAGRAAGSARRTQVMTLASSIGLGISALTLVGAVPHLTRAGGVAKFGADLFAHGWTLAIVTLAVGSVRTLGWRAFVGTGLMGFLAVPAIAALIGRPVVSHLGTNSGLATAGWAPLTEETLKALPVLLIAVLAARRRASRPSAADLLLLGLWSGAGFALFENAVYGRGGANWSATPLVSLVVPSGTTTALHGRPGMLVSGHMLHTGLLALGIAITLLYKGIRWRRWALPAAFLVAVAEHSAVNGLLLTSGRGGSPGWAKLLAAVTLHGWLSILLFFLGSIAIVTYEWRNATRRAPRGSGQPPAWLIPSSSEIGRRGIALASLQLTGGKSQSAALKGGQR
jgi:RsiW-degrading membrane proteinase PrsW (M82 family)